MPAVSTAAGFSPTARSLSPKRVRNSGPSGFLIACFLRISSVAGAKKGAPNAAAALQGMVQAYQQREEDVQAPVDPNKESVNFHTDHSRGSLARVLTGTLKDGALLRRADSGDARVGGISCLIPGGGFRDLYNPLVGKVDTLAAGFLNVAVTY